MNVLITGGAGFIGSHLCERFLSAGHTVAVLDAYFHYAEINYTFVENLALRKELLHGAHIFKGSTLDARRMSEIYYSFLPDVVVHLASLPVANIAFRNSETAFQNIAKGTHNLLEILKEDRLARLVYISSSMVYGHFPIIPIPETAPTNPVEPYGAMKLAGEILVKAFSKAYSFPSVIVRPSAVYGPGDCNRRVVQIFLECAITGRPATLYIGTDDTMDFTYVKDVVDGIYRAAIFENVKGKTFNITRGEGRTLQELAEIIKTLVPSFEYREEECRTPRPARGALDISLAKQLLHYEPCWSLEAGVSNYFESMLTYNRSLWGIT